MKFQAALPVFNDISQRVSRALGLGGRLGLTAGSEVVPTYPIPLPPSILAEGRGRGVWTFNRTFGAGNKGGFGIGNPKNSGRVFIVTFLRTNQLGGGDSSVAIYSGYSAATGLTLGSVAIDRAGVLKRRQVIADTFFMESVTGALTGGVGTVGTGEVFRTMAYSGARTDSTTEENPIAVLWPDDLIYARLEFPVASSFSGDIQWSEYALPASS